MLRRTLPVAMALALLLPATFTSASPAARGDRPTPHPRGLRAEMIEMRRDGRVTRTEMRRALRRAALELAGLDDVPDDLAGYGALLPAGDLDGDGLEDAIEDHWWEGVSAVRGTDGETIWAHEFDHGGGYGFGFAVPAGDLDGQGSDDLIEVEVQETDLVAAYPWNVTYRGVRGSDGATLWTRSYDNPWAWADAFLVFAYVDVGFPIYLGLAPDADGDGAADLLHARFDIVEADTLLRYEYQERATVELISGRTGDLISTFTLDWTQGYHDAAVLPDVTGDGLSDVVALSADWSSGSTRVAAHGGLTGTADWTQTLQLDGAFARGVDLSGGTGDVLLQSYGFGEAETTGLRLLSGTTGVTRWAGSVPGEAFVFPAGDATGDGTQELLVVSDVYDWDTDEFTTHLRTVDGNDGSALWSLDSGPNEWAWPAGDATGDGVTDATLQAFTWDDVTDEPAVGPGSVISGSDGRVVWSQEPGAAAMLAGLEADLDGDGHDDLVALDHPWEATTYTAVSGAGGDSLWASPAQVSGVWLILPADVGPSPGPDLLESSYDWMEDVGSTAARSGADGSSLWQRRFQY